MKRIVYTRPDGGIDIVTPIINTFPVREEITEEQAIARAVDRLPDYAKDSYKLVDEADIPGDRAFRNGWQVSGEKVDHDMGKCREIHKDKLREIRAAKLAALDVEFLRATEAGDEVRKAEIVAKKQALRDVTDDPRISAAATPEELKAVVPEVLQEDQAAL